jgi:hypothetical protein
MESAKSIDFSRLAACETLDEQRAYLRSLLGEEKKQIDWVRLAEMKDPTLQREYVTDCLRGLAPSDLSLSDLIINHLTHQPVLTLLAEKDESDRQSMRQPWVWRIQVLRDEWGDVPQPGDVVARVVPKNRKTRQGPVSASDFNRAMVDGSFSQKYEDRREYKVDDKGCILVPFGDAVFFLQHYGYNSVTGHAVCGKPEFSEEPVKCPRGGQRHVHYWRYSEISEADYARLPPRVKPGGEVPKPQKTK